MIRTATLLQIKKLKNKRKWRLSHKIDDKEEPMPDPTEIAQKKMEEIEKQYAIEKEVRNDCPCIQT